MPTGRALPLAPTATLPAELMPDINAGETGYRDYVMAHPLGREAFASMLTPNALALWRDAQGSMDTMHARIFSLQEERARLPGRFAGMLQEPEVMGGLWGGILSAVVGVWLHSQGIDPLLAFLGGWGSGIVSGTLLGGALAAFKVSLTRGSEHWKKSAQLESDITATQSLVSDYETFTADKTAVFAEHPEIYDDYLGECLKEIDAKIGNIAPRRAGFNRDLAGITERRVETAVRKFDDESLRAVLLGGLDDDATEVQRSLSLLDAWEAALKNFRQGYENRREEYSGKLKSYRARRNDLSYAQSLKSQSQQTRTAIAELETKIRVDLTELAAMAETTAEFGARQLAAIEVGLMAP